MRYKISYTQNALADLDNVSDYIKYNLCNISAADRIVENFFSAGDSLDVFPNRYPLCNDDLLRAWGIRFVPVKNYLLFYVVREKEQTVYVIRFLYGKRDWQNILRKQIEGNEAEYSPYLTTTYVQEAADKYVK